MQKQIEDLLWSITFISLSFLYIPPRIYLRFLGVATTEKPLKMSIFDQNLSPKKKPMYPLTKNEKMGQKINVPLSDRNR